MATNSPGAIARSTLSRMVSSRSPEGSRRVSWRISMRGVFMKEICAERFPVFVRKPEEDGQAVVCGEQARERSSALTLVIPALVGVLTLRRAALPGTLPPRVAAPSGRLPCRIRAGGPAGGPGRPRLRLPATPLVVFLGDSLTAGLGLDEDQAYPALLERQLREEGKPVRVVNAGVSGDTTAGGLARLGWLLEPAARLWWSWPWGRTTACGACRSPRSRRTCARSSAARRRPAPGPAAGHADPAQLRPLRRAVRGDLPEARQGAERPARALPARKGGRHPLPQPGGRHPPHGEGAGDRGEERAAVSGGDAGGEGGAKRATRALVKKGTTRTNTD